MRKILLLGAAIAGLLLPEMVKAQTFTVPLDTVTATVGTTLGTPNDNITNITASAGMIIKWRVIASDFPTDWLPGAVFGICDNNTCYPNTGGTVLWNTGTTYFSVPYILNTPGLFGLSLDLAAASSGKHYVKIELTDTIGATYTKNIVFVICHGVAGCSTVGVPDVVSKSEDKAVLYPNPANSEINIVYDGDADIRDIAVYNVIGKMISVYKVNGNTANLDIMHLPSGMYFVRLYNDNGNVVVTRKFTKQ